MEVTNRIAYDVEKSAKRIDDILSTGNGNFEDKGYVPSRSVLTHTNGYYVKVTALFIDIVGSSDMTDEHKRPVLAKTYRSFISECTAIMNESLLCKEVNIHGDCVWGVFDTPNETDIDSVFFIAAKLNSLIKILNHKLRKKGYSKISVGIGMDYGRALMIKSGYLGSGLNDVIWMGDVINSASHLSGQAGRNGRKPLVVSSYIHEKLSKYNQGLLTAFISIEEFEIRYEAEIVDASMDKWYFEHCK